VCDVLLLLPTWAKILGANKYSCSPHLSCFLMMMMVKNAEIKYELKKTKKRSTVPFIPRRLQAYQKIKFGRLSFETPFCW
jgi:hypothetical protein